MECSLSNFSLIRYIFISEGCPLTHTYFVVSNVCNLYRSEYCLAHFDEKDALNLFFSSSDETIFDEEEEIKYEPDSVEDLNESSDECQSYDEKDMDISNASDSTESDADVSVFSFTDSVCRPYASSDSDLQKFIFSVSNPGIRLSTGGWYEGKISFFQFFSDDIIKEFV